LLRFDPQDHKKIAGTAGWHWRRHRGGGDAAALAALEAARGPQGRLAALGLAGPPFRVARHIRAFLDAPLLAELASARAAAAAARVATVVTPAWERAWEAATERAETLAACGHHQPPSTTKAASTLSSRVVSAGGALRLLTAPQLIVGFHPDQATDHAVDLALALRVPFAVVPCCTFASHFPDRRLPVGARAVGVAAAGSRAAAGGKCRRAAATCAPVESGGGSVRELAQQSHLPHLPPPQPPPPPPPPPLPPPPPPPPPLLLPQQLAMRPVHSYDDLLAYLCAKHPAIRRATLDFGSGSEGSEGHEGDVQPRNTVLYMLASDFAAADR
jgi:hypothetical protein